MTSDGHVLSSKGEVEDLSAATAYAVHMAQYIGESLGLDAFMGCELRAGELRTVVVAEANGDVLALQSQSDVDVAEVRARIGL